MKDYKADSRRYFDTLASRYERHYYGSHGRQQYSRVIAAAGAWRFTSVLDVGCGVGSLLALLRRPRLKLAGVDISPQMIKEAKRRLKTAADLRVADSESLPWKANRFDLVVSTDSFHHWPHPLQALAEVKRVLRKGGHFIIADVWSPTPLRQLGNWAARFGREGDVGIYSEAELARMLTEVGFVEIKRVHISFMAIVLQAGAGKKA
jgi:ubiquinone/menaquinone biosynthesis C-methylase UbiE